MYRILLVEDDRNIRELIFNYFTKRKRALLKWIWRKTDRSVWKRPML